MNSKYPRKRASSQHPQRSSQSYADPLYPPEMKKSLSKVSNILRRHLWLSIAVFVLIVAAVAVYTFRQPPQYQADSLILINEERPYDPNDALSFGHMAGAEKNQPTATQLIVLEHSPAVAEAAARRLLQEAEAGTLQVMPDAAQHPHELALLLQEIVTLTADALNAVRVSAISTDADEAALIANVYAESIIDHVKQGSRARITASRSFLEQHMTDARAQLQTSEAQLEGYMQRENTVSLDQEAYASVANSAQLEAALAEAQIELDLRQAMYRATEDQLEKIRPRLTERVASGVDREIEQAQQQVSELELRIQQIYQSNPELRQAATPDPRVADLEQEVARWKQRINVLSAQYVQETLAAGGTDPRSPESGVAYAAGLERQLITEGIAIQGIQKKITTLERQLGRAQQRVSAIPQQTMALAQLERSRASAEQLYTYLENKLREAEFAEKAEMGSLQLLQPAYPPSGPVAPRPVRNLLLGGLLGLLLGVGAAFLRNRLDGRIYTPEDVEDRGLRLLSVVPDMQGFLYDSFKKKTRVKLDDHEVSTNLVSLLAPFSAVAEAYRHLYTRMQLGLPDRVVKTVLVTSPEPDSGKSTTALNLAITTARAHRRTLIIDADMRRASVHRYLGLWEGLTLQELLAAPPTLQKLPQLLHETRTGIDNLHAITVRTPAPDPLEYLVSDQMRSIIETLSEVFDIIIFDSPPLLLASDAALLTPLCDATIVIASAELTDGEALQQVVQELEEAGGHIMGGVLNRFDPSTAGYKSTYGYRQRHYTSYFADQKSAASSFPTNSN